MDDLADKGIHLVGAFHLAGFSNVVGTLWDVSDPHCVDIARILYETIKDKGMTDKAVCLELHRAVRALRDGFGVAPEVNAKGDGLSSETNLENQIQNQTSEGVAKIGCDSASGEERNRTIKVPGSSGFCMGLPTMGEHPRYWAPYIHFGRGSKFGSIDSEEKGQRVEHGSLFSLRIVAER